ncbi:MAG: AAA family ATPase [Ruminiclostridium sp.]
MKIDAANYDEYRKRVDYLYGVCQKNGLEIDKQNRNPSRLSRLPGVIRGSQKQYIIDTNIGKSSWTEWKDWIESINDDLPEPENVGDIWENTPELSPPLIDNILRQGHKMLLAGPSKAGKSFGLIELCCAIAEGKDWFGFKCTQGKVMYVNLELDRASCLHRFKDVYKALGWQPSNISKIDIWHLRGKTVLMDKLAPKLIRRAAKKDYIAIIIDPIYKVITGDENSADQMAHFCNQFDRVCTELGCAVIYCHHHSKGAQGGKRSMDRASGSGVFARDPDALLDLIELELTDSIIKQEKNKAVCAALCGYLDSKGREDAYSQDEACNQNDMRELCRQILDGEDYKEAMQAANAAEKAVDSRTAWRIEGTLREFPKFPPLNLWFDFHVHKIDNSGVLKNLSTDNMQVPWQKNLGRKKTEKERQEERKESIITAFDACAMGQKEVSVSELAEYLGVTEKTARNRIKEHGGFYIDEGKVGKKPS